MTSLLGVLSGAPEDDPARPASWALLRALFRNLSIAVAKTGPEYAAETAPAEESTGKTAPEYAPKTASEYTGKAVPEYTAGTAEEYTGKADAESASQASCEHAGKAALEWAARAARSLVSHAGEVLDVLGEEEGGGLMASDSGDAGTHRCAAVSVQCCIAVSSWYCTGNSKLSHTHLGVIAPAMEPCLCFVSGR